MSTTEITAGALGVPLVVRLRVKRVIDGVTTYEPLDPRDAFGVEATVVRPDGTRETVVLSDTPTTIDPETSEPYDPAEGYAEYVPPGPGTWYDQSGLWEVYPIYTLGAESSWESALGGSFYVHPSHTGETYTPSDPEYATVAALTAAFLASETGNREAADASLAADIAALDTDVDSRIADEADARDAAIAVETSARQAADTVLQGNIVAEAAARAAAVAAEASARAAADTALVTEYDDLLASPNSYAAGDLLYATGARQLARRAAVAAGSVLLAAGVAAAPVWGQIADAHVADAAAIGWTKISKTGSSLADLAARSAGDLATGNLAYARLPNISGTWDVGAGNKLTLARPVIVGATSYQSADPAIVTRRTLDDTVVGNGHSFVDESLISRTGTIGYAAYDSDFQTQGAENYDHIAGFQARHTHGSSGTLDRLIGYQAYLTNSGGTVTRATSFEARDVLGSGTVTENIGLYIKTLTRGASNYAIKIGDSDADMTLIAVGVSGSPLPRFNWSNGTQRFALTKGLRVDAELVTAGNWFRTLNTAAHQISGGSSADDGANLALYGGAHASTPNLMTFRTGSTQRAQINASGNFGFGSSDVEAWGSGYRAFQMGGQSAVMFSTTTDGLHILENAYYDGAWKYRATGAATRYLQSAGAHTMFVAASGTIDTAVTWATAWTLNNSGNLGIGTTDIEAWSSSYRALQLGGQTAIMFSNTNNGSQFIENAYFDGAWKYRTGSGGVSRHAQSGGQHTFFVGPAGTIDTEISWTTALTIASTGSVVVGGAALATDATAGFLYIPTCAGTPTGTPASFSGRSAIVYDSTNNKLYVYDSGGGWIGTPALT